jgi:predicted ATPase
VHARAQLAGHHRGAFVGRQAELGALLGAAEKVRDAVPQVVGVRGDAGTGKTRLVAEFRARIGTDVRWLEGRAYPYSQDTPYAPLIDLFSRMLGIEETDPPAAVRAALAQCVADLLGEAPEVLPLLLHLFHLEQEGGLVIEREAFRERLEDAIRRMVSALAKRAPTVVCVQDLHWADPSTLALLQRLGTDLSDPVLLLTNYRSGFVPGPDAQELVLGELSPLQTCELLNSLLDGAPPTELARFVTERSDGNPFYIEEIVNSLVETQALQRGEEGWTLTRPLAEAGLPSTIRGVIAARIDRLDETRRRVLRQAAVVGREFLYAIVARVADDTADLGASLSELQSADLIRAHRPDPDLEYIFKHALTQDVAYEGLLRTERQVLHARTAQAMEAVLAERIPEFVETLAFHWLRAGVADKAEAGRKCVERFALPEATSHFRHAYALLADVNRTPVQSREVAELLCAWSQVHYYEGTIGEWRALLELHLDDAERCNDDAVLAMYLSWLGNARYFNGDCPGAHLAFDQALATGTPIQARRALAYTQAGRVFALFDAGRIDEAVRVVEAFGQTEDERLSDPYPVLKQKGGLTMALSIAGKFAQARDVGEQLIEFGTRGGHACAVAMGHSGLSWNALLSLDFDRAIAMSSAGIAAARDDLLRASNADLISEIPQQAHLVSL